MAILEEKKDGKVGFSHDPQRSLYRVAFNALGTRCSVQYACSSEKEAQRYARAAVEWVSCFEGKYSRFVDTSLLSEINRNAGARWVQVDAETERIFALCDDLNFMTNGLLDPTALPLIQLWDYRRKRSSLPAADEIEQARSLVGWSKLERRLGEAYLPKEGMALDFGGFGKEYAVDKVAALAVEHGIAACLVNFGQDIHALGTPPDVPAWHVGLEDPKKPEATWTGLAVVNRGVATSGDYLRNFEYEGVRYGHIIDPRTGRPVMNGTLAVSIVAQSCLEAGVLSTSAFTAGAEEGMDLIESNYGAEGCFISTSGIYQSSQFYEYVVQK